MVRHFAIAALTLFAAVNSGCTLGLHYLHDKGVDDPVPLCEELGPELPPDVQRGEAGGVVLVDYTVRADGRVDAIEGHGTTSPEIYEATRAWLSQCKFKPGAMHGTPVDVRVQRRAFGFYAPYSIDHSDPQPLEWDSPAARGLSAPRIERCFPDDPLFFDSTDDSPVTVVVQRDGRAGDTRLLGAPRKGAETSVYALAALWLRTCKLEPARDSGGNPVAVRVPLPLLFRDGAPQPPEGDLPIVDGCTIPIPKPTAACNPHPWRPISIRFANETPVPPVEVTYVVDAQGRASQVTLQSPERRELFHPIRRYLLGCTFEPARDAAGRAIPVLVKRGFDMRWGVDEDYLQRFDLGLPPRVIEGEQP